MDEYIKKETAIKSLRNDCPEQVGYSREDAAVCIFWLDASNVAPVRHAMWKRYGKNLGECSECGDIVSVRSNYCPNCGAKMDGGTT